MGLFADQLRSDLESGKRSIAWRSDNVLKDLAKWIAMRDSDKAALKTYAGWDKANKGRPYKVDSIPEKIAVAWADFLYGEDPTITARAEQNQERLVTIMEDNDFIEGLHGAVDMASSEGEAWYRIYVDESQQTTPIVEWISRTVVIPLFRGKRLMAAAIVNEIERTDKGYWVHIELHDEGMVQNLLYFKSSEGQGQAVVSSYGESTGKGLGAARPLTAHNATEALRPTWDHGLDLLVGRVPNRLGRDKSLGLSDYVKVEDQIFDLNEAHTIDSENFKLAGKKRAIMPKRFANKDGEVDAGEEIFFTEDDWDEMDGDGEKGPFKILEYSYDGASSIARKDDLTGTILTRVGLARQFVDANAREGFGVSGTNLKVRLIPTTLTARGKSRAWDRTAPHVLMLLQLVDALDQDQGGFGTAWTEPGNAPAVERASVLPEDPTEEFTRHGAAVGAGLESVETALREIHPEWEDGQISAELEAIRQGLSPPEITIEDVV